VTFSEDLLRELRRSDPESARQIREAVICRQELEILTMGARDVGVRIEHGKEVGAPTDLADANLIVAATCSRRATRAGSGRMPTP
jgi:hypothetical protein